MNTRDEVLSPAKIATLVLTGDWELMPFNNGDCPWCKEAQVSLHYLPTGTTICPKESAVKALMEYEKTYGKATSDG